jgi:hypothetical protein
MPHLRCRRSRIIQLGTRSSGFTEAPMVDAVRRGPGLIVALLLALNADRGYGASPAPDSWEDRPPQGLQGCTVVDSALLAPVPPAHRPEAIARLENVSVAELDRQQVWALLDLDTATDASGSSEDREATGEPSERHRYRIGSWDRAERERLDRLRQLEGDPATATLRPFLVRAVAKHEGTGAFFASICKDGLVITHGSLGHSVPPSVRLPVIVFLDRTPMRVFVDWRMAE